jgi:hypothetical protein
MEADLNDSGLYELVARNEQGESQSRRVELTEEAVIKGKTFSAGEVVQVSRKEADGLVEAGKGTVSS